MWACRTGAAIPCFLNLLPWVAAGWGQYLCGAQDQPFLILLQAWLSPPDRDLTAGCLVLIELRLLGIDNPANTPGKVWGHTAPLLLPARCAGCSAAPANSCTLPLLSSPMLPAPFSNSRISLPMTAIVSHLCAAGESPAGDTGTCTLASGSLVSSPHRAISLLTQCIAEPPLLLFLPASLMFVPGWERALLAFHAGPSQHRGVMLVWPGRGDSSCREFCLIHPSAI